MLWLTWIKYFNWSVGEAEEMWTCCQHSSIQPTWITGMLALSAYCRKRGKCVRKAWRQQRTYFFSVFYQIFRWLDNSVQSAQKAVTSLTDGLLHPSAQCLNFPLIDALHEGRQTVRQSLFLVLTPQFAWKRTRASTVKPVQQKTWLFRIGAKFAIVAKRARDGVERCIVFCNASSL